MSENKHKYTAEGRKREIYKVTVAGSIGNLLLLLFKFAAGIAGHSAAMVADAVHSLSDFITDVVILFFVRLAAKPKDSDHDFGHGKYETIATALIGIVLIFVGFGIFWNGAAAIWRYIGGEELEEPGMLALVAAVVSIVTKEALYQYTAHVGRRVDSQTVVANAWHHRSDAFSSIGTALGIGGAVLLTPAWRVLDPAAAVVVSFFIVRVAYKLIVPCVEELMEKSLPAAVKQEIVDVICSIPGVEDPHNMRTRKIGNYCAVNVHVRMNGELTVNQSHEITRTIESRIRRILGAGTIVDIHVEPKK